MTPEDQARLEACTNEIAEILYRNSNRERLDSLEGIEGCASNDSGIG